MQNIGDVAAEVEGRVYDDNILISPPNFSLTPKSGTNSHMLVDIGFKKEPFTRQTFKVEFVVKNNNIIEDRSELFIEYIPKSGRLELEHP